MQGDNGKFIMLDRFFNPAGVPNPDDRANVIVSMFEPKDKAGQAQQSTAPAQSDDIPF